MLLFNYLLVRQLANNLRASEHRVRSSLGVLEERTLNNKLIALLKAFL